jgi:hypothetical protein
MIMKNLCLMKMMMIGKNNPPHGRFFTSRFPGCFSCLKMFERHV